MNLDNSEEPGVIGIRLALGHPGIGGFLQSFVLQLRQGRVLHGQAFNLAGCGGFRHLRLE